MNGDHDYAIFTSKPKESSVHQVSLETETYEEPPVQTESPVSSRIFFPDGYGCEAGGRFDQDELGENDQEELGENDQENLESGCIVSNPKESSVHPVFLDTDTYKEPDMADMLFFLGSCLAPYEYIFFW